MRLHKDPILYKQATKNILAQIESMHLAPNEHEKAIHFVQLFRESFTKDDIKKATFLVNSENGVWDLGYDSAGFCRVSSITFMIAMDWHDWQLMSIDDNTWKYGHHWLVHKKTGKVLDLTYDQFINSVPYKLGKPTAMNLSLQDETHVFAKSVGMNLLQMIARTPGK